MSCILRLNGRDFDVDAFVENSGLSPYSVFYMGECVYKSKPDGRKLEISGCLIQVSSAGFDAFKQQVNDAIEYLSTNQEGLWHIPTADGLDYVYLDFGVKFAPANCWVQSQHVPPLLIKLAAEFNIGITISMYPPSEEESNQ